ncbi:MAG: hypothetical protein JXB46_00730 [Candidatus Eisenbacteria bacterium]|nr:hypothetical protein [Candidatus Eisenbacteria bacterium]
MVAARDVDYWGVVTRSIRLTWEHKFLWFFGFFAASGGSVFNWGERGTDEVKNFFLAHLEVLVIIVLGLVLLWLFFFVMNVIAKGALIGCIARTHRKEHIGFDVAWTTGFKTFWGLLGILVTGFLAFLVVSIVCGIAVVIPFAAGAAGMAIGILIAAILFVPYVAFLFALTFIIIYAEREYVIRGASVGDALAAGWRMTRSYPGKSLLMWLVSFLSGIVFFISLAVALLALSLPFILIGLANLILALVLGIPIGIAVLVLASSAFSTYDHALWTLFYIDLLSPADQAEPSVQAHSGIRPEGSDV